MAAALTDREVDDASQVGPLLDRGEGSVASVTGDDVYDREGIYADIAERHPDADVVVPPRSTAAPGATAGTAPPRRDRHPRLVAEGGRMGGQKATGYNACARAEAAISRSKRVIGDGLRSRTDRRRATEEAVAVHAPNRHAGPRTPEPRPHRLTPDGVGAIAPATSSHATRCPPPRLYTKANPAGSRQ